MIRIQQLKLPVTHTQEELEQKIRKTLKIGKHDLQEIELLRRSIDARKKSELKYVYQLDVKVKDENAVLRKVKNNQIISRASAGDGMRGMPLRLPWAATFSSGDGSRAGNI